ncbi:MAG TPA: hypothetical protein VF529_06800 [Solirubrobacteraceae bacterium]
MRRGAKDPLRDAPAPGEAEAQRRAWRLAEAAFEQRPAPVEHTPLVRRPAFAVLATAMLLVIALTPPGSAVADWLGDAVKSVVDPDPRAPVSGLDDLPGGGRLLVLAAPADGGAPALWVAGDGGHEKLGAGVTEATWSPHGLFVALARGGELIAVDPRGERRWALTAPGPVAGVRWSPDGFRIAYTTGDEQRLVAGDGTGDRRVASAATGAAPPFGAPAWRPGPGHVLAFADTERVFLADVDARRVVWERRVAAERGAAGERGVAGDRSGAGERAAAGEPPAAQLAFSPDGRSLLVDGRLLLDAGTGRPVATAPETDLTGATWHPDGRRFAVVRDAGGRAEVLLGRRSGRSIRFRRLFAAGALRLGGFSPDGRRLLVDWPENDSWLFLSLDGTRPRQLTGVRRRFGARDVEIQGWCCPRE